jgi:hypothetical protein
MSPLVKNVIFIGAIVLMTVIFIHFWPWLVGILALCGVVKLYRWLEAQRDNRPPRWV